MSEELSKKAIVIVYPDGYIDAIDVNQEWDYHYHKAYYDIIKKYSNKIKMYCDEIILNGEGHKDIDNSLTRNGCAILLNWDMGVILEPEELATFFVLLPNEYGSVEQIKILKNIINNYKYKNFKLYLNVYNEDLKRCKSTYEDYVLEEMERQEIYLKEGMKNGKF